MMTIKNSLLIIHKILLWGIFVCMPGIALPSIEYEYQICGDALKAAGQEDWSKATLILKEKQCPTVKKLVTYLRLKSDNSMGSFEEYTSFIIKNPNWPWIHVFKKRAELVVGQSESSSKTLAWFKKHPPKMAKGLVAYVEALKQQGFPKEARVIIEKAWLHQDFSHEEEKILLANYKDLIPPARHLARAQRLLRENKVEAANRLALYLPKNVRQLIKVRLALRDRKHDALKLLRTLSEQQRLDVGLIHDELKYRLRNDDPHAYEFFKKHRHFIEQHPEDFWSARHTLGRDLMTGGRYQEAYQVIHRHGLKQGEKFVDAEWLLGWISLSFLKQPGQAFHHFNHLYQKVNSPYSRSKAAYWAGRAAQAQKLPQEAHLWYQKAAYYPATYYGQLALKALQKPQNFHLKSLSFPLSEVRQFENHEFVRAIKLLHKAGLIEELLPFGYMFVQSSSSHEALMMLSLASTLSPQFAVGMADSMSILHNTHYKEAYPQVNQKKGSSLQCLEEAMIHALIRKESKFNPTALSEAGACGMMQVTPSTAKMVAQKLGIPFSETRLRTDMRYNMLIGTAYLKERLQAYQGSVILTLAAYNAGPGSVKKWIERYGDPRNPEVDATDWVEKIPYGETRNYIQRVLENYVIYQAIFNIE
ncbi:MAG: hypothetical protein BGO76_06790 [Caedibacter sp. 38-128]|nr:lytic transglycosylase domain-containing protein [Holosporales bacterium]OJX03841.1 MAG: hypothetical protein BGO76_06790 [Caedibacter sp. 38-128]